MKMIYIAPLTEIVYLNAENILEQNQDSKGILPGDDPDLGANSVELEPEELEVKTLWDD